MLNDLSLEASRRPAHDDAATGAALARRFRAFGADTKQSLAQFATTLALFVAAIAAMAVAAKANYWLALPIALPAAGLLVRLFIIQHDCGHGSYFRSRAANDALGRALSVLTLTPYGDWRQGHAIHHASSGNLDRRGRGDVDLLTLAEYDALSPARKLGYRLYRNPLVMVLIGAPLNFIVLQRIPRGRSLRETSARRSILALDLALLVAFGVPMAAFGVGAVLAIYLPIMIIASWIGNWLFYVQHQFDDAYWQRDGAWSFHSAAVRGSSYFELAPILQWFSGNIGLHHVHHLCSRVPNYRLRACLDSAPELNAMATRITLRESWTCWRLALWDEKKGQMVGFREVS